MRAFEISVPQSQEDLATALLWELETTGIEVRPPRRRRLVLLAYFPDTPGLTRRLRARLAGLRGARMSAVPVPQVDWVAHFRDGFRPFVAGGFRIVPSWMTGPADAPDPRRLVIEPGRAFGTGTHATTRLCIGALEELAAEAPLGRVADLGTGTGILSMTALRLGARTAAAVEIDPEALGSARLHARLNAVPVRLVQGDLAGPLLPGAFDTVIANLIASMLSHRAAEIFGAGRRGARFVLSGILVDNLPLVRRKWRGLGSLSVRREGEWAALVVRPARP
jgi:ribosomal protein L11 methyltransferase